jgi:hypothetical protein
MVVLYSTVEEVGIGQDAIAVGLVCLFVAVMFHFQQARDSNRYRLDRPPASTELGQGYIEQRRKMFQTGYQGITIKLLVAAAVCCAAIAIACFGLFFASK